MLSVQDMTRHTATSMIGTSVLNWIPFSGHPGCAARASMQHWNAG